MRVAHHGQKNLRTVLHAEYVVNTPGRNALGHGRSRLAGHGELQHVLCHQKNIVFEQRGLDLLPAPGLGPLHERGHGAHGAEQATHDVVDTGPRPQRVARSAGHIGQPAHHLHHFVQRCAVVVRAGEKAFVADINQPRVARAEGGVVQAEFLHGLGFEVLAHDVGGGNQAQHHLAAPRALKIQRNAFFIAVKQRVKAGTHAQQLAGAVAAHRLDLDHVRTHVPQRHAAGRTHDHVGKFDDTNAA